MNQIKTREEKRQELIEYYQNKYNELLIVGFNDSQGVNTTSTFFKKGLLEYLAKELTTEDFKPEVINAFSLLINKTEHIDYILKNNLSVEEIKLSQVYSAVSAFEKVMKDIGLPKCLGKIAYAYKTIYRPKKDDSRKLITNEILGAEEPTIIYSSGVNNLMREVANNPFSITKDYEKRMENSKYYYTLEKSEDYRTLNKVIDGIESNFETILKINENSDIYTLGAYIPKSLNSEGMEVFADLIGRYNESLKDLCNSYNINFIDTEQVGKNHNNSATNFHISTSGHNELAEEILDCMYENKIATPKALKSRGYRSLIPNYGSISVIEDLKTDRDKAQAKADDLYGYEQEVAENIVAEHSREIKVFEKVMNKKF